MSAEFDSFAGNYSEALRAGLSVTGESQEYFASERIRLTAQRVRATGRKMNRVLDFGCGQGSSTPLLKQALGASFAVGADISDGLLDVARNQNADRGVSYVTIGELSNTEPFDCVYMNGVLHHIHPAKRLATLQIVFSSLIAGGLFALWENNPWNPGTRYIMSRIPFDRDAVMLSIPESRKLLRSAGFQPLTTDTLFFFPRFLRSLRPLETLLSRTRLGGQYLVVSTRQSAGKRN